MNPCKNRSIDLLMRLLARNRLPKQFQHQEFPERRSRSFRLTLAMNRKLKNRKKSLEHWQRVWKQEMNCFHLAKRDRNILKEFHKLPEWLNKDQLLIALKEKSVLLVFSK